MSIGSDLWGLRPAAPRPRAQTAPEAAVVPPALYTLRAIVLGVAGVIATIGVLAFVQVPSTMPGPADAAASIQRDGLGTLGRAAAVRELDTLPVGLDAGALAAVTRAEPEPPMAATPPAAAGTRSPADHAEEDHGDEGDKKGDKGGKTKAKAEAGESPGKGHGKDRDDDDDGDD